jgi:hypothetical protein
MSKTPRAARFALASLLLCPFAAASILAACSSSSSNPAPSAVDASSCPTPGACNDATIDAPAVPGSDAAPDDASVDQAVSPDAGSQDASDAALAADVDQNCSDYAKPATTSPTSVRITNGHGSPVYIGLPSYNCKQGIAFTLTDSTSTPLDVAQNTGQLTCSELQTQCMGPTVCDGLVVTKVQPGKYFEVPWTGTYFAPEPMPAKCYGDAGCHAASCIQEFAAPAGTVSATAYTLPLCGDAGTTACGSDCSFGSTGTCYVPGATLVGGTAITASATWSTGQAVVVINVP